MCMLIYKHICEFLNKIAIFYYNMTKICIFTYGCAHNQADSETMKEYLVNEGFEIVNEDYDLVIFNTCTVKNPTEDKFFSKIVKEKKPLIVCGCIPQSGEDERLEKYSLVGLDNLDKIVQAVRKTLSGEKVIFLERRNFERIELPSSRDNKFIAKIPILQGCMGNCAYCKTKFARGNLRSFSMEGILNQIRKAKLEGVREIWLVSQDNGCYGLDIGLSLVDLLKEIVKINLDCKVRIGMLNPNFAYEYREELAEILMNDCFYKFLHIPAQAGSDSVLKEMGRKYNVSEFEEALKVIKKRNPSITFSTDIICGFPTETEEDFDKTLDLVSFWKFVMINVSKFYPRSGTMAAKMKLLSTDVVKKRSSKLMKLIQEQNPLKKYIGKILKVNFVSDFVGYTDNYISVFVEGVKAGEVFDVEIISVGRFSMKGGRK